MVESLSKQNNPHLGIPEAVFIEDVDEYMKVNGDPSAEALLSKLDERYQKYKLMELNLMEKKKRLQVQIPDIKSTLDVLKHLLKYKDSKSDVDVSFLMSGALHAKATIPPTETVCLWLGANVMLSYPIHEAQELLSKNFATANKNLDAVNADLDFLRDQFTTTEVTMARVYNWDVRRRKTVGASK